jgi:ABC-type glycerol-3-phosphate transport system substrate-binding protein
MPRLRHRLLLVCAASLLLSAAAALRVHGSFYQLGVRHETDKVVGHKYGLLYDSIMPQFRLEKHVRLLEIGLGCGMPYGEGHSAIVWRKYFGTTDLDLWVAEYNEQCGRRWEAANPGVAHLLYGDQANNATLQQWMAEAGAAERPFDVIIDDGGHSWRQQTNSFFTLWSAVAPGGYYFLEDLVCAMQAGYNDGTEAENPINWIKGMIETLAFRDVTLKPLPVPQLKSIQCTSGMCVFEKCSAENNGFDAQDCGDLTFDPRKQKRPALR